MRALNANVVAPVHTRLSAAIWRRLCRRDELGDSCCVWAAGAASPPPPFRTTDISHPSVDLSVPSRQSCTLAGPPAAVVRPFEMARAMYWAL